MSARRFFLGTARLRAGTSAAGRLAGLALLSISCALPAARPAPSSYLGAPILSVPGLERREAARMPAAPALQVEPTVFAPSPALSTESTAPAAPAAPTAPSPAAPAPAPAPVAPPPTPQPTPEVAQPLPGAQPFMPEVERWRGLVRQLIAEARADGRLAGPAAVLNEDLVLSVIEQESGGDPDAESWAGARGLMQLMPESFSWIMGIHDWGEDVSDVDPAVIRDPATNLRAGVRFLAAVLEEQGGSVYWALASYNAGGGMVNAWRAAGYASIPDWYGGGETANYAPAILGNYTAHHPSGM